MLILGTLSLMAALFSSPDYAVPMLVMALFTQSANVCHKQDFRLNLHHAKFA